MGVIDSISFREHVTGSDDTEQRRDAKVIDIHGRRRTMSEYLGDETERDLQRRDLHEAPRTSAWARLLQVAEYHAPKLARRRDDVIGDLIEREILKDARWILKDKVPADKIPGVINDFTEMLWAKIRRARQIKKT